MTHPALIPLPAEINARQGHFSFSVETQITAAPDNAEVLSIAGMLAGYLAALTGQPPAVLTAEQVSAPAIQLVLAGEHLDLGDEGYHLQVSPTGITIQAPRPVGLFWGVQTLCQMLPPTGEAQQNAWHIPAVEIRDWPRFSWRGAMLDVARHFFAVADVKRFIDLIAAYKINRLHLHLTDDQGWRIMINSWPDLAKFGGSTCVGGGPGGFYTQADYAEIVDYAHSRYITIVPEIDMPGHTNAALAAYPALNCDEQAPDLYTGMAVGFSSLCIDKEITYQFAADVINEVAALTPGPYIHIGGDEAQSTELADYQTFIKKVQAIIHAAGKRMVGWQEILHSSDLLPDTIAQYWNPYAEIVIPDERKLILSPGNRTYLDMQYQEDFPLGLFWAGYVNVQTAYDWEPLTVLPGLTEEQILGIEAPLWTETILTIKDIEMMLYPRLPGIAEIGWSAKASRDWESFRARLAAHGSRWEALNINYYKSPLIEW